MFDFQIVIPVYNSQDCLPELVSELAQFRANNQFNFEVLFIDDNCPSQSLLGLEQLAPSFQYKIFSLSKNNGQHTATAFGLAQCTAPFAITMDDDLQHAPQHISLLLKAIQENELDLVYATFHEKKHEVWRNLGTRMLKRIFEQQGPHFELVTGYRIMSKSLYSIFNKALKQVVFIDAVLLENTDKVGHIVVSHQERAYGKSSYSKTALFKFALRILLFHSSMPLKIVTRFGFLLTLLSFSGVVYFVIQKYTYGAPLGFTSLIVAILFSTGIILSSIGIIGEFLRRMWQQNQGHHEIVFREINHETNK